MNYGNTKNEKYQIKSNHQNLYDPFHATGFFLYPLKMPLKIPGNQTFFLFFQGEIERDH